MLSNSWSLIRQTFSEWSDDGAPRLGAALAYYSVFSIGPVLLIAIGVAALFFEASSVRDDVIAQISGLIGARGADAVRAMLDNASIGQGSLVSTVIGIAVLLFGAIGVVVQLKDALNIIWDVEEPDAGGLWGYTRKYALSLAGVLGLGFLLTVSLITTTAVGAVGKFWSGFPEVLATALTFAANFGVLTLLFAMMFKWLPDVDVEWRDVWIGAAVTAALFEVGKLLIAFYLSKQGLESTFGAAASIVLLLVWVYYSAQIIFFGAEFTQVYARRYGSLAGEAHEDSENAGDIPHAQAVRENIQEGLPFLAYVAIAGAVGFVVGALVARS